ncbi:MAG: TonB-dependent siderophore receptor [Methylorubrum populi]
MPGAGAAINEGRSSGASRCSGRLANRRFAACLALVAASSQVQAQPQVTLEELSVQGVGGAGGARVERADGPVNGYVAKRSASGTKTDTPITETPQSISVVPARQIRDTGSTSFAEALAYTPGVAAQAVGGFGRTSDGFTIRGFNVETGNAGLLRDGLKLQSGVYDGTQEPYGLERLEVLKGAASILYGQLSPGGVINAVSKRPLPTPYNELNYTVGSFNRQEVSGDFSGPLTADGEWSYRLTGLGRISDSYLAFTPDDKLYIAPAVTWHPSAGTWVTVLGYYQEIRTRFPPPLPGVGTLLDNTPFGRFPIERFYGEPNFDRFDSRSGAVGYMVDHAFSDTVRLRHSLRYYQAGVDWDYLQPGTLAADRRTFSRSVSVRNENATGIASDTSLETKFALGPTAHTLIAGIDYYRSFLNSERFGGTAGSLDVYTPVYGRSTPIVNYAVNNGSKSLLDQIGIYAQDQIRFDRFLLLLGGRQDFARTQILTYRTGARLDQNDDAFSGRVGLLYLGDDGLAPYVSFSQSFQTFAITDRLGNPFQPTTGEQVEGGLRWEIPGADTLLSGAVFEINQRNALVPDPIDPTFSAQTGQIRSQGAEFEARSNYGPLQLVASYSYTDTRQVRTTNPAALNQRVDLVPYHLASAFGTYEMSQFGLPGLRLGGGIRYIGSSNITGATFDTHPATLVDLVGLYDFGVANPDMKGWRAQLNLRNVTDRSYVTCQTVRGCRFSEPLNVFGTIGYRW